MRGLVSLFARSIERRAAAPPGGDGWPFADTGELCALMLPVRVERPGYELGRPPPLFP